MPKHFNNKVLLEKQKNRLTEKTQNSELTSRVLFIHAYQTRIPWAQNSDRVKMMVSKLMKPEIFYITFILLKLHRVTVVRDKEIEWILSSISCDGITAKLHRWEIKISLKIFRIYYDLLSSIHLTGTFFLIEEWLNYNYIDWQNFNKLCKNTVYDCEWSGISVLNPEEISSL